MNIKIFLKKGILALALLFTFSNGLLAQDTEFWFVGYDPHNTQVAKAGFLFSNPSTATAATVTITFFDGSPTQTIIVPANSGYHMYANNPAGNGFTATMLTNPRATAGKVVNGGMLIKSTSPITAAVYMGTSYSQDIFTLKGKPALGKEFYVSQTSDGWAENAAVQKSSPYTSAFDQIDIMATENGTQVTFTPTRACVNTAGTNYAANTTYTVTLNRGQVFKLVETAQGTLGSFSTLAGTKITSDKPITVTSTEDHCNRDAVGDQLIPTNYWGTQFAIVQGSSYAMSERIYMTAQKNGTKIYINDGSGVETVLTATKDGHILVYTGIGRMYNYQGTANQNGKQAISIRSEGGPIAVQHIVGYSTTSGAPAENTHPGGAMVPSIYSTSQKLLSFYQVSPGSATADNNVMMLVYRTGTQANFKMEYNNTTYNYGTTNFGTVQATGNIPGLDGWSYSKVKLNAAANDKLVKVVNSESVFSLGYQMTSSTNAAACFGFLSGFGTFSFANITYKCLDKEIDLDAGYAKSYKWWKGVEGDEPADASSLVLSTASKYTVPAGEHGLYTVKINQDPHTIFATTNVKVDFFKANAVIPKFAQKGIVQSLSVSVDRNEGKTYLWTIPGSTPATATTAATTAKWDATGVYATSIKITSDLGCDTTCNQNVTVYDIQDDYAQTILGIPTTIDVLANDDFTACGTPTLSIASPGSKGTASIVDGKIDYSPTAAGVDEFTYKVICGELETTAKVYIYIAEKPDNISDADCYINPQAKDFTIKDPYNYGNGKVHSMSTPLVANLTGDGPEILAPRARDGSSWGWCTGFVIVNVKENTVREIATVNFAAHGQPVAIADVDGDGECEIFIQSGEDSKIYCYSPYSTGKNDLKSGFTTTIATGGHYIIQLADLNADGEAELIAGPYIFNAKTGALLLHMPFETGGTAYGSPHGLGQAHQSMTYGGHYFMPAIGDVDGDGYQEVVAGGIVYKPKPDFSGYTTVKVDQTGSPAGFNKWLDGPTVLVDFDKDGQLDICVIGYQSLTGAAAFQFYAWNPRTRQVIAYAPQVASGGYGITIPYVGDLDNNGYPDFAFARTNLGMMSYQYDNTQTGNIKQGPTVAAFAESAGFTMFDFNQDGKADIVYRGYSYFYIVNQKDDGSGYNNLTPATTVHSGTVAEYPIVADVDEDGQAEIILCRAPYAWNGNNLQGMVSVYKANDPAKPWAPARKVWNQWAYNAVNINEDMTVPQYPVSPAAILPNGKQPYNGFLQQMTLLNANGDMLFLAPEASFDGNPAYTWRSDNNTLEIKVKVKNLGDADLQAPVYATAYKESISAANKLATGSCATNIGPGATGELTIIVPNISDKLPITSIIIRLNDNDGNYPVQAQCRDDKNENNKILAQIPVAVNDTENVRSNQPVTVDILANDTYSCSLSNLMVSIVPPISTNAAIAAINAATKKLEYQSNVGFNDVDKIYYKIQCNDSDDASIAIVNMVIYKPVMVEVVAGKGTADENGLIPAQLRFKFTDNITHDKAVQVTYQIESSSTAVYTDDYTFNPVPYKIVIPANQPEFILTLNPTQNFVVQGSRDVKITIVDVTDNF